jgi:hypothetical protein
VNAGIQLKPSSQEIPTFKTHNLTGSQVPALATPDDDKRESCVIIAYRPWRPPPSNKGRSFASGNGSKPWINEWMSVNSESDPKWVHDTAIFCSNK